MVDASRVYEMHMTAPMVTRVGSIAGDEENRYDGGKTYHATAKPVTGSETHPCHYAPRP